MKKNDLIEIDIEKFAGESGLTHLDGVTLFVSGALPGERVQARLEKLQKNIGFAKTLRVLRPSQDRREPRCPFYAQCGGCTLQHMTYEASLAMKRDHVADVQKHIGGIDLSVPPVIGMENPWHYRNKSAMPVGGEPGNAVIGYYAPRSHRLIDISHCLLITLQANEAAAVFRSWMNRFRIPPYREETRTGLIRHFVTRVSRRGEIMATVVTASDTVPHLPEMVNDLCRLPGMKSICLNINPAPGNVILSDTVRVLYGQECLKDELCGLSFSLSPLSFFQVNPVQTEKLYAIALDFARLTGKESVCDLYCGAGTISLMLAKKAARVLGIEAVPAAVENARENARENGIGNVSFLAGEAENLLPALTRKGFHPDVFMLDPPRKGCDRAVLDAIASCGAERIVYIACDPATQARDIRILTGLGYRAEQTQSVDMFCQTGHVETVVQLSKRHVDSASSERKSAAETGDTGMISGKGE